MSEKGEYVIDQWYFFHHSEVRKNRYHADSLEEANRKLESLISMDSTSRVRISKKGFSSLLCFVILNQHMVPVVDLKKPGIGMLMLLA